MVYVYFYITIFSCISIFLLSLRCYSQKKDNLRALMIFQKDLHLPVAWCKSRGVTILLPVYNGLPFLTSRLVWNPIILGFRSSVENFESYCLCLCSVNLWKPLSTMFLTLKKDLSRSCQRHHMTFLNWLPFYVCLWPRLLVFLGLLTLYIVFTFLCIYASFYINAFWNWLFT